MADGVHCPLTQVTMASNFLSSQMPDFETSLLDLALRKGLLSDADVARSQAFALRSEAATVLWSQYGPRVDALIAEGILRADEVHTLVEEVGEAGGFPTLSDVAEDPGASQRAEEVSRTFPVAGWDRYEQIEYLAQGGMARVFRAEDPRLKRTVALKLLDNPHATALKRFLQEARAQARVDHPHVCHIYEVGEVGGHPYIAMEFINGLPIDKVRSLMGLEQKVQALKVVAEAVHAAHRLGLIHRDLKPPNILVEKRDEGWWPVVLDFGLAGQQESQGLTVVGSLMGTPEYMAPEQARGETDHQDRRTDVYALGATLFTVLLGRPPFRSESLHQLLMMVMNEEAPRPRSLDPRLPEDLETIILKCLEKEPHRRYDSAKLLAEDLQRYLDGEPLLARPTGWRDRVRKLIRRNRTLSAVVAVSASALVLLGGMMVRTQWQARTRAQLAQRFGLESERMEGSFRLAQRLPLHDMSPHKAELRAWMARLEGELKALGPETLGPGHFALGRACLTLGEPRLALGHLERAWQAGNQGPEMAAALGLAHIRVLEEARREAEGLSSKEARDARMAELQASHGRPALAFLRLSGSGPSVVQEGRIAFLEERYDEALAKARQVLERDPWLVEAHKLVAQVELARSRSLFELGAYEAADQASERGLVAALDTQNLARSDVEAYLLEGDAHSQEMGRAVRQGRPYEAKAENARAALDKALHADPESAEAHVRMARLYYQWADGAMDKGQDLGTSLELGIHHGLEALRCSPDHPEAAMLLARTYRVKADQEAAQGRDPLPDIEKALAIGKRTIELRPRDAFPLNLQGNAWLSKAECLQGWGQDSTEALTEALADFLEASRLNPAFSAPWINQGICYRRLATQRAQEGGDPLPLMAKAQAAYQQALKLNPRHVNTLNNLGILCRYKAETELRAGQDPGESLAEGARAFQQALEINPNFARSHAGLGDIAMVRGLGDWLKGGNPMPAFQEALARHRRAFECNAQDAEQYQKVGQTWLQVASYAAFRGAVDRGAVGKGITAFQRSLQINGKSQEALLGLARLKVLQATPGAVAEAAQAVASARILSPRSLEPMLFQAELAMDKAEHRRGEAREALLREAEASLAAVSLRAPGNAQREVLEGMLRVLRLPAADRSSKAVEAEAWLQKGFQMDRLLGLQYRPWLISSRSAGSPPTAHPRP